MDLNSEQKELLPSESDIAFYEEHGYYVSPIIFDEDEMEEAEYGIERYYAGERDFFLSQEIKTFEGWKPGDGEGQRINDYVSLQNREISELVRNPLLGAIAARLCGTTVRLWHDQLIYKPPGLAELETGIGWHTDRAYWKTCTSSNMLTAWIAFHDCDDAIGPLTVIDGSHRWAGHESLRGFHETDWEQVEREIVPTGSPVVKVPLCLKKGQISIHHCLTIHGSGPNRADIPRVSLSVHMQDDSNRYCEYRDQDGEIVWHRNDVLCREVDGRPDYRDPDVCPVLWSE